MKIKTFALLFVVPALGVAEPVYLNCTVKSEEDPLTNEFHVKLNEDSGKITHTGPDGAFNTEGFFSANAIAYQRINVGDLITWTSKYKIDRTNLAITHTRIMQATDPALAAKAKSSPVSTIYIGSCEIEQVKNRKI